MCTAQTEFLSGLLFSELKLLSARDESIEKECSAEKITLPKCEDVIF
jgi:hypothetical protein